MDLTIVEKLHISFFLDKKRYWGLFFLIFLLKEYDARISYDFSSARNLC